MWDLRRREIDAELKRRQTARRFSAFRVSSGLYVHPRSPTSAQWVARATIRGKPSWVSIGPYAYFNLDEARAETLTIKKAARQGRDPIAERRRDLAVPTFKEASEQAHAELKRGWSNGKHVDQWMTTVRTYAWPIIGDLRISDVSTADIQRVLSPIWISKPETARRLRQRLSKIIEWAEVQGFRDGPNPVAKVKDGVGLAKQTDTVTHFTSLPWPELPAFMTMLSERDAMSAFCARFIILTVCRSGEGRGARWSEIDLDAAEWLVPAERKKERRPLRIPLSPATLEILDRVAPHRRRGEHDLVFPAPRGGQMSDAVFRALFRRLGRPELTIHGFRSTFSTWRAETDAAPREIGELCLGHQVGTDVERAYQRSDLLSRRRTILEEWARHAQ